MNSADDSIEQQLRARISALLDAAGVEVTAAALMLFSVPSRSECRVLIAPDGLHESIQWIAGQVKLEPVLAHRGVWLHIPATK